ncbi:MAG: hypothetical protein RSC08_06030, partial [Oscillospiraceae bacterium]
VPVGATLLIPYSAAYDKDGNCNGTTSDSSKMATAEKTYRTLTIGSGVTLTINGKVLIGGVMSHPHDGITYQGHTSGAHGRVTNNGAVVVDGNGAILDCYGFLDGSGTVTAQNKGRIYEPFVVMDYSGGSNTYDLYMTWDQSPFKHYAMQNVTCAMTLKPGATLWGHCNLHTPTVQGSDSGFNKTDTPIFAEDGLFVVDPTTTVTRTYNAAKHTADFPDIGTMTYEISGGMSFHVLEMDISGTIVSMGTVDFPIPYNYNFVLSGGTYTVPSRVKLMPGGAMTVSADASLVVKGKGRLYVLDGLTQSSMSGKHYPAGAALSAAGFSQSGDLVVNGAMTLETGATFGGVLQTSGTTATLQVAAAVELTNSAMQDGGTGTYADNTARFALPARLCVYDGVSTYNQTPMLENATYTAHDAHTWTLPSYEMSYAVLGGTIENHFSKPTNGDYYRLETKTVAINQPRTGSFTTGSSGLRITTVNKTAYDATDATRTTIAGATLKEDKTIVFTVAPTAAGAGYTHLVQYQKVGENAPTTLTAANGTYTVPNVNTHVTITVTAVKPGDANLDNIVDGADAAAILQIGSGSVAATELQTLAADKNADQKVNSADAYLVLGAASGTVSGTAAVTVGGGAVKIGEQLVVPVTVAANPGITNFDLQISYDKNTLTLDKISAYPTAQDETNHTSGGLCAPGTLAVNLETGAAAWASATAVTENGALCYLYFTPKSNAITGTYPVSAAVAPGGVFQKAGADAAVNFTAGSLAVAGLTRYTAAFYDGETVVSTQQVQAGEKLGSLPA